MSNQTMTPPVAAPQGARIQTVLESLREQLLTVVAVSPEVLDPILIALLARGHALIEGIPGIGKTLLARTLARCIDCAFNRIQFTNDLMPSDIVGSLVWRAAQEKFVFVRGPLFGNLVLADEINRTSPRTLSCLLEAMENGRVSIEGKSVPLASPFLVLATRNPIEFHGTYPVPEAALDRFLLRVELGYPGHELELALYQGDDPEERLQSLEPLLSRQELLGMMEAVSAVAISPPVATYCHRLVQATRAHPAVALGASPRAGLAWLRACRARALLQGRGHVLPDDLKALAQPVLAHRIFLKGSGSAASVLAEILSATEVVL
jgi:MoxR-like ATPase